MSGDTDLIKLYSGKILELAADIPHHARLDAPDWDRCTRCGAPIGAGRLQAVPWAATCVGCAA